MSSNEIQTCPRTCGRLSTAALFLCVGVVQLLSGIILLRSEYVYLLAGIDFIAAISNSFVGGSLGISSSVWERKENRTSTKSIARQNVLAGLFITVMAVNATTAIIMIMGDGHKLLTVPEEISKGASASFIAEILACAYVASVCSPIVCVVVALVCLSGNRIQIYEHAKSRENLAKESSGWIYDKKKVKLSDVASPPSRASFSEDNVFLDKNAVKGTKSLLKGHSKQTASRYSLHSINEIQSPLEFLAQKRRKILEEITSSRTNFFADDYLQFPEFKYGSYVEKVLPRIKTSSLHNLAEAYGSHTKKMKFKETEFNSANLQTNESNKEFIERQRSYSDSASLGGEQQNEIYNQPSVDVTDSKTPRHHSVDFNAGSFSGNLYYSPRSPSNAPVLDPCEVFLEERNIKMDSSEVELMSGPVSSRIIDFKADTINELKSKLNRMRGVENFIDEGQLDKNILGSKFKYSDSDVVAVLSNICEERNVFSDSTDFNSTRQTALSLASTKSNQMDTQSSPAVRRGYVSSDSASNDSKRATSVYVRNSNEKSFKDYGVEYQPNSSVKHFEKRRDVAQKISSMGSIPESPSEANENDDVNFNPTSDKTFGAYQQSPKRNIDSPLSSLPPKRSKQTTSSTNLLKKIWSASGSEASLSGLIMDADSLVGLSDEELMARTNRIRILRKSVEVRSKTDDKTSGVQ